MTSRNLVLGSLGSTTFLIAATLYQGNNDMNHKLWNIVSTEINSLYTWAAAILLQKTSGKFAL